MDEALSQLTTGGILVVLIVQMFLKHLEKKANGDTTMPTVAQQRAERDKTLVDMQDSIDKGFGAVKAMQRKAEPIIDKLDVWHSKTDESGLPLGYVPRSLEASINNLTNAVNDLATHIKKFYQT